MKNYIRTDRNKNHSYIVHKEIIKDFLKMDVAKGEMTKKEAWCRYRAILSVKQFADDWYEVRNEHKQ